MRGITLWITYQTQPPKPKLALVEPLKEAARAGNELTLNLKIKLYVSLRLSIEKYFQKA